MKTLASADNAVKTRLQNLGFTVTVKSGTSAVNGDATGKSVVVISSTVSPNTMGSKFKYVSVPVITWDSGLFPNLGFTTTSSKDYGTTNRQTQIQIIYPSHTLAAGLSGTVTVYGSNDTVNWGKPTAAAQKIATVAGDSTKVAIFGYSTGASMVNFNAPAKRVGLFMSDTSAAGNQNNNAWALFNAAIYWATH